MSLINGLFWLMLALIPLVSVLILAEQKAPEPTAVRPVARTYRPGERYQAVERPVVHSRPSMTELNLSDTVRPRFFDVVPVEADRPADLNFDWMAVSHPHKRSLDMGEISSASHHCA